MLWLGLMGAAPYSVLGGRRFLDVETVGLDDDNLVCAYWHVKAVFVFYQYDSTRTECSDFPTADVVQESYFISYVHCLLIFLYAKIVNNR